MPFHRGTSLVSPTDGTTPGFWIQLSTDAKGVWTGSPRTSWPAIVLSGGSKDTLATYGIKVSNFLTGLCTKTFGVVNSQVVKVIVTFTSLSPLTLDPDIGLVVSEGDCKSTRIR